MRCSIVFGILLMAATLISAAAPQATSRAKGQTSMSQFDQLIQAKDWDAVDLASQAGPAAVPHLESYLRSPDHLVRLLAVDCAVAAGGPQVPAILIRMLSDANEQVRINAINGLKQHLPLGHDADLMAAWDKNSTRDAFVRQQLPMILGLMQSHNALYALKQRMAWDPREEVQEGMIAGAAKLGDPQAREALGGMLRDARGKRTAELMEFVRYEGEPWVIPLLVPVLGRRDMAIDLSTHRHEIHRRDCDLAVDEVLRISRAPFSFQIDPMAQYRDDQIAEALRYASSVGR
jgi:HEAT repeat protein